MKKLSIIISALLIVAGANAQKIDRTQPPKAGPAPVISLKDPVQFKLSNGMTILVVEKHKLPVVSASLLIDAGPVLEGDKTGVMSLMGSMLAEGTKTKSKAEFDKEVDQMGSTVGLNSSGGSARALTRYFDKTFFLMADALKNPALKEASFDKLKSMALTSVKSIDKSAPGISARVVRALTYGKASAMGEFETEQSLNSITLQDVINAYRKYITPSRSYLTFVGDITPAKAKELAEKAFGNWKGNSLQLPQIAEVANPAKTEIDLIDVPSAVQSEITVTNLINLPMSSPDYFAVLLANQILGGGATSRLFMNLREKHGFTYGSYSSVSAGRYQTTFKASASVRNDKVDSAVAEIMKEIDRIRTEKVTQKELDDIKALYVGSFALGLENPALPASFASTILINGLDKNFYRNYLKNINKVTIDDIQRVAKKYFQDGNARIIVVGKESAVKPGLEKLGYPVNLYDKFADPVTTQSATQPAANSNAATTVSAKDVIANYIKSVGGESAWKAITTMHSVGSMSVQGMSLDVDSKDMAPNLSSMTLSMGGNPVVTDVFDGTKGWRTQMGQKMDYSADEVNVKKDNKSLLNQLNYFTDGFSVNVAGVEKVNGKDAYKLIVKGPSGQEKTEWYDVQSGYLVKTDVTVHQAGQAITQEISYSDYRKTGDVMIPYTIVITADTPVGQQEMTMNLKTVTINKDVTKNDFK